MMHSSFSAEHALTTYFSSHSGLDLDLSCDDEEYLPQRREISIDIHDLLKHGRSNTSRKYLDEKVPTNDPPPNVDSYQKKSLGQPTVAVVLKDYSNVATTLFNNMRTPAALIGGAIIPLGIAGVPMIQSTDSASVKILKNADMLLAVASLLSEIIAITYSTIAINKIAELHSEPTTGVAEFIATKYELEWIGTNIHFLLGMFGFGLLAMAKPFWLYGPTAGLIALCWALSAMLFCVSIVNKGIAMGSGHVEDTEARFASNLFGLWIRYIRLLIIHSWNKPLRVLSMGILLFSLFPITKIITEDA